MNEHQRDMIVTAIIVTVMVILAYSLTAGGGLWEIDPGFLWGD
jgi:hypothetical protein